MIRLIQRFINHIFIKNRARYNSVTVNKIPDNIELWYTIRSVKHMKKYKNPWINQKFFCEKENECYKYIGNGEFVCIKSTLK